MGGFMCGGPGGSAITVPWIPLDRCRTIDRASAHFFFFFCPALLLVVGGVEGELEASEGLHSAVNVTGMVLFDANARTRRVILRLYQELAPAQVAAFL